MGTTNHPKLENAQHPALRAMLWIFLFVFSPPIFCENFPPAPSKGALEYSSLYLSLHAKDPVHWKLWNTKRLKEAKKQNKPILISSGYYACHWCHVMHTENYKDTQISEHLNRLFINVKVDRELSPNLDRLLLAFSKRTTGSGGWPLHVVLTPDGYPFYAFGYLPKNKLQERLTNIGQLWSEKSEQISRIAKREADQYERPSSITSLTKEAWYHQFQTALLQKADLISGGLKGAQKFPHPLIMQAALSVPELSENLQEWVLFTLDQWQSEGLQDHINGGFFRYTVDPEWQQPHFEKMLYTQALVTNVFLDAYNTYKHPDYLDTALKTLNYVYNQLYLNPIQLYSSSQSALDTQGQDGGRYLWNKTRLKQTLSPILLKQVETVWDDRAPLFELGDLAAWLPKPTPDHWKEIKTRLAQTSISAPIDSKAILGWNGLLLSTIVKAYIVTQREQDLIRANQLAETLLTIGKEGSLPRSLAQDGTPLGAGVLEDYVFVLKGLSDWQKISQSQTHAPIIKRLTNTLTTHFHHSSGWSQQSDAFLPIQKKARVWPDTDVPSPSAIITGMKLSHAKQFWPLSNQTSILNLAAYALQADGP